MAKKKTRRIPPPPIDELYTLTAAAQACGVSKTTLHSAAGRGDVKTWETACGRKLTTLEAVRSYQRNVWYRPDWA